jgi:SAM-dependent methyltransferase
MTDAAQQWRDGLASWAIPDEILRAAPESPWIHPVEMFTVDLPVPDSPSHRIAREALPVGGTVLDVGCGGGRAALALVPPAGRLVGVDHQQGMLDAFADVAGGLGVAHEGILGDWPEAAARTPDADVVVCHHVAYNVADLGPFLLALDGHAHRRVVLELPWTHPLSGMNPLWEHFWGLSRPTSPTAQDALELAREVGLDATLHTWEDDQPRTVVSPEQQARFTRIRLCLPPDREPDVAAFLDAAPPAGPRRVATLWWDVAR